jgi:CrcB protein
MEPDVMPLLAVIAGGGLGGFARAWLCARLTGARGLAVVNMTGSFALGLLAAHAAPASPLWLFAATGVLGAYTTVSSFALQSVQMWQAGAHGQAGLNVAGSVLLSVGAVALGLWVGAS